MSEYTGRCRHFRPLQGLTGDRMTASILVCEYIKHGMTCGYGNDALWTLLGLVFVIWLIGCLIGCLVCAEIKHQLRKR
jgi:hypothetical protein